MLVKVKVFFRYLSSRISQTNTISISFSTTQISVLSAAQIRISVITTSITSRILQVQSMLSSITGSTTSSEALGVVTIAEAASEASRYLK